VVILRDVLSVSTMPSLVTATVVAAAASEAVVVVASVVAVVAVAVVVVTLVVVVAVVEVAVVGLVAAVVAVASRGRRSPFKVMRRTYMTILRVLSNCTLRACGLSALKSCTPRGVVGFERSLLAKKQRYT